jgi:metal-responsive CopG/Arc/MetJ family transcriptional regulator
MKNAHEGRGLMREERLQIMLSPQELKAVDNFRFEYRMPSRAAAVRELLRHGLATVGAVLDNSGVKSGDYGVLKAPKAASSARDS